MTKAYTLAEINGMPADDFVESIGWVFEHSPWVAKRAHASAPFASLDAMHDCMTGVVREASAVEQLELLRAHPDLAGRLQMTDSSVQEQQGAGLTDLTPEEFAEFTFWNTAYTERFGFPFILAVRGHNKASILAAMKARYGNTPQEEKETALREVARIARLRLQDTVDETGE
ncbi:OHCU decarboxylase [Paenibacillus mucilaginosus 3016]|uniref:2-oxo-4-hydroxy-4-carboxy-5-ureidoimidazoline decarboxylase n=1 Tax=Paenibacillus mucilaginosus 3016 TaxID=1116391 RepID=H6NLB0_9BACL|nr:2-oxo-4-hydroxy-4-carboxy-5-ureidoimidazoline decarboxylase [Paenibacillus mucilaginosus]AFC30292.1 OHCU decarboxylase [Paenibacillus mucilaginosus 3016]WFA18933.1 2-oxo-4-hydroxy-4-carboxy-5-ureidoimidazoline decarboxylase [Paenibacillus mucilaginosus]